MGEFIETLGRCCGCGNDADECTCGDEEYAALVAEMLAEQAKEIAPR